jgi:hypothetical protein
MKSESVTNNIANAFSDDYKAEVIAAELINNEVPADQIMIVMLGPAKRPFRKDVDAVLEELSDYNNKEYTLITTHKEGIYDMLPEGLFHSPVLPNSATTQKDVIENMKRYRREEQNARRFFLPYEAGINHLRIQLALYESRMDKQALHNEMVDLFKDRWEIFTHLNSDQANVLLRILPLVHDLRDDYSAASLIFELIFSPPINIYSQAKEMTEPESFMFSKLDGAVLGIDFTTGNEYYHLGEDEIVVNIGPLDNEQLSRFAPGKRNRKILDVLSDYFLPVHMDIKTVFNLQDSDRTLRLQYAGQDENSTLGLNTYL